MSNLSKLLSRGNSLVQQGDLAGARTMLEKAARQHEGRAEPWISLAAVHGMGGDFNNALRCARRAAELAPKSLQAWVNLANAAESCGDYAQASEAWRRARGLPGCPPEAVLNYGLALVQLERWAEAVAPLRDYCARHPGHREATLALGKALARSGEFDSAITVVESFSRRNPGDTQVLTQLGFIYHAAGRVEDAWRACDQAMAASPGEIEIEALKAALLMFEGRYDEARDQYERLLRLPQVTPNPRLLISLSEACHQLADPGSIAYARMAVEQFPRYVPALTTLGMRLINTEPAEARKWMEAAEALAPGDPAVMTLKGQLFEFEGDKQGAWECVRAAIETGSADSETAGVAARVAPAIGKADEVITLLEQLVDRPGLTAGERRSLHFTLARLCDKAGQYDRAFGHAVIANRLKNAWYDSNAQRADLNRLKAVYSETSIKTLPRSGNHSELPVFIVGMPRSGTSLMEQILSCHSRVHARGETQDVGKLLVEKVPYYPDGVRSLTPEKLDAMAEAYLQKLRQLAPQASRVTDKMPGNYVSLGIISQVFPGARIINCRRDPRDICISHFLLEFGRGLTYSYDLESFAHAYEDYRQLMEHWNAVLSLPILNVRYEELIADPQTWVARILDFCGLEWEDACLDFHKSKRQVITASYDQVRKPLYTSSVARWKHYERHLEPVSRILGLQDDTYP